jgi:hypothetical protein
MKYIDLSALPTYSKLEIAVHQLDRAIKLLLDEKDPISAITLAGAAEEILGKLVNEAGGTNSLEDFIDECIRIGGYAANDRSIRKEFADMQNYHRNQLKHLSDGSDITISLECANGIIERAAENLWLLNRSQTLEVKRYFERLWG